MSLYETFSPRSRRAIYRAHSHAQEEQAAEITTEHLLLGLLHEDPELFIILMGGNREIVGRIEKDLPTKPRAMQANPRVRKLRLSKPSKEIIRVAARERVRLGHTSVATQHLLLALLICPEDKRGWFGRAKKQSPSFAGRVLSDNGLSACLLESETKTGIVTPQVFVLNDRGQITELEREALETELPGEGESP